MKKSQYTAEQITFALRQAESGTPVSEVCRKMGISEQTFYRWKRKYIGMGVAEVRRLKILEEETRKLKQPVADLSLDKQMLQDVLRKSLKPAQLREQAPPRSCKTYGQSAYHAQPPVDILTPSLRYKVSPAPATQGCIRMTPI